MRWRYVALLLLCLVWRAGPAIAAGPAFLDPGFGQTLQAALGPAAAGWTLASARVERQQASGRACNQAGTCVSFVLRSPSASCAGTSLEAGCLQLTPNDPQLAAVFGKLRTPWQHEAEAAPAATHEAAQQPLWWWALAWVVVPLVSAGGLALPLRRRRSWLLTTCGAVAWLVLGGWLSLGAGRVGLWDGLGLGTLAALAWTLVLYPGRDHLRRAGLAFGAAAIALVLVELVLRLSPMRWPAVMPASRPPWFAPGELTDALRTREPGYCPLWGPPLGTAEGCRAFPPRAIATPAVLHIGDSLLAANGLPPSASIPGQLEALLPASTHLNTGVGATSLDVQTVIAERWLQKSRWDAVVLHIYPCNDLLELDEPHGYCGDQSALVESNGTLRWRCPTPTDSAVSWTTMLRFGPPPFPLHLWAPRLTLARAGVALVANVARQLRPVTTAADANALGRYRQILRHLRRTVAQHPAKLGVVMMPMRASACAPRNGADREGLLRLVRDEGLPLWDTQPLADASVRTGGESQFFLDNPPGDPHLNPHGLAEVARWLAPQLGAWLAQQAERPGPAN